MFGPLLVKTAGIWCFRPPLYKFDNTALFWFAGDDADEILEYLMDKEIDVRDVVEEDGQIIVHGEPSDSMPFKKP